MSDTQEAARLAVRLDLGLATLAEVAAFVDRSVAAASHVDGPLLDCCGIAELPRDEIALRLIALVSADPMIGAALAVVATCDEWEGGRVELERAVDYVATWSARLPEQLAFDAMQIPSWIEDARAAIGYVTWADVAVYFRRLAHDCRVHASLDSSGPRPRLR